MSTIIHLDKEQTRKMRRQMLSDTVYILFHDILKQWRREEKTTLSPQEIFLAATRWSHMLTELTDAEEGLEDEMDDLEEEAETETDAMLIMMTAAGIIQAMGKTKNPPLCKVNVIIRLILKRWCHHKLYYPLMDEACKKELARWAENKRNNLLEYELTRIDLDDEDAAERGIRELIDDLLGGAWSKSVDTIKELLLQLNKYNIEHHHRLDKPLLQLYAKLSGKADMSVEGGNQGIMAGGDVKARLALTDDQVKMLIQPLGESLQANRAIPSR